MLICSLSYQELNEIVHKLKVNEFQIVSVSIDKEREKETPLLAFFTSLIFTRHALIADCTNLVWLSTKKVLDYVARDVTRLSTVVSPVAKQIKKPTPRHITGAFSMLGKIVK